MTQIQPFNDQDPEILLSNMEYIKMTAPIKNLTDDEVLLTLRLLQLQVLLREERRYSNRDIVAIRRNDIRLELLDDHERFLAMLIDCDLRDVMLTSKRCRSLFGGTVYHWRKIGRTCPITAVASALSECSSGYYGRGWVIAPHIRNLRKWIIEYSDNEQIKNLKV